MAILIREVAVTPELSPDLIVFRREEIYRFVAAARRTAANLQAQLDVERARPAGPPTPLFKLPPWTEAERVEEGDNTAFFESLRDQPVAVEPSHPSAWLPVDIERLA
jgi:hypothetical protein